MKICAIVASFCEEFKRICDVFRADGSFAGDEDLASSDYLKLADMLHSSSNGAGVKAITEYVESCDPLAPTISADGVAARYKGKESKQFHVGFGVAEIQRRMYQGKGGGSVIAPLDHMFGVADEYFFPDIREAIAYSVAVSTPEEVVENMAKLSRNAPSATAVRRMVRQTGEKIEAARAQLESATSMALRISEKPLGAVVASMDGATAPIRIEKTKDSRKYKVDFKVAMAGTVGLYGEAALGRNGDWEMERIASMGFARMPEEKYPTFKKSFDDEVAKVSAALPASLPRILLMDGATHQWSHVEDNPLYEDFHKLIDYYHMSEHLHDAAEALFGSGTSKGRKWKDKWEKTLLEKEGKAEGVWRSIEYFMWRRRLGKLAREQVEKQVTYFRNNYRRMNYAWFRSRGLPIGSGPVEACCKSLIKRRLCDAGMSWVTDGGQSVLTLRAHRKAGDWNRMWSAYNPGQSDSP